MSTLTATDTTTNTTTSTLDNEIKSNDKSNGHYISLAAITSNMKGGKEYNLKFNANQSLMSYADDPGITDNLEVKNNSPRPMFVIISSDNTDNRTSLAKYISFVSKSLYWDLAKAKVGNNTFHGTMFRAFGGKGMEEYASDLKNGRTSLIIDHVDEAYEISGYKLMQRFFDDIKYFIGRSRYSSVYLFTTAKNADTVKDYFESKGLTYAHYQMT